MILRPPQRQFTEIHGLTEELGRLRAENEQLRTTVDAERNRVQGQWVAWLLAERTNGVEPDAVVYLAAALTNETPTVRIEATKALRQLGLQRMLDTNLSVQAELDLQATAKLALHSLISALKDSEFLVRANAAITLGFLHDSSETSVPALVEVLNEEGGRVALTAKALGRFQLEELDPSPRFSKRRTAAIPNGRRRPYPRLGKSILRQPEKSTFCNDRGAE